MKDVDLVITIRPARTEDAREIVQSEQEIAKEPGYFCSNPDELTEESIRQTIESHKNIYLVAVYESKIVGHAFLEAYHLQSLSHVADLNIAVHLGWQKKGIGTKLLEQIIESAKNSGVIEKIQLSVRDLNIPAISLYKKMGFKEEGRLRNQVKIKDAYVDDIVMGLDLRKFKGNPSAAPIDSLFSFNILIASPNDLEALDHTITDYNISVAPELSRAELYRLDFSAKNQNGELLGGIQAKWVNWGILEIELLLVFEKYRHQGIASKLLQYVEQHAREHKCHIAHLDTFDFQAKDFYLKHGYSIFGTLENAPKGHCRYYMKKEL